MSYFVDVFIETYRKGGEWGIGIDNLKSEALSFIVFIFIEPMVKYLHMLSLAADR